MLQIWAVACLSVRLQPGGDPGESRKKSSYWMIWVVCEKTSSYWMIWVGRVYPSFDLLWWGFSNHPGRCLLAQDKLQTVLNGWCLLVARGFWLLGKTHTGTAVGEQFILSKRSTASSTDCDSPERVEGHGRR